MVESNRFESSLFQIKEKCLFLSYLLSLKL